MAYKVKGWDGIAVELLGYPKRWVPFLTLCSDEDGNEWEEDNGDGEWEEDAESGQVIVRMIGDDRKHTVDKDDLIPLQEDEYCSCCGQIGCHWG